MNLQLRSPLPANTIPLDITVGTSSLVDCVDPLCDPGFADNPVDDVVGSLSQLRISASQFSGSTTEKRRQKHRYCRKLMASANELFPQLSSTPFRCLDDGDNSYLTSYFTDGVTGDRCNLT